MARQAHKAPDRGSFPLDHFHECDEIAQNYHQCIIKHQLMPKRCRQNQIDYLDCRMKAGLMEKEELNKLGFTDESSWENEEQEQKFLFNKLAGIKQKAWENQKVQSEYFQKTSKTFNAFQPEQKGVAPDHLPGQ